MHSNQEVSARQRSDTRSEDQGGEPELSTVGGSGQHSENSSKAREQKLPFVGFLGFQTHSASTHSCRQSLGINGLLSLLFCGLS